MVEALVEYNIAIGGDVCLHRGHRRIKDVPFDVVLSSFGVMIQIGTRLCILTHDPRPGLQDRLAAFLRDTFERLVVEDRCELE